jgi:hypothetical protein
VHLILQFKVCFILRLDQGPRLCRQAFWLFFYHKVCKVIVIACA